MNRVYDKSTILKKFYKFWINYLSPNNFNYRWNFGSIALVCLILQIATGVFLAMHYKSDINLAFASVEYIIRDVQYGWVIRYLHSNGASVFFLIVYLHILRSLLFGSFAYPRQLLWSSGIIIFVLMIATSFFGYILPWGQMSFWAATVIISVFSAIPIVGNEIVFWLWGGFSVDDATLNRFFSLHFLFPFIILGLSLLHIMFLHEFGSNHPMGSPFRFDGLLMTPYYIVKDVFGLNLVFIFLAYLVFLIPNYLGHSDNYILGNPLVTPPHIVPEWYFLPLYAVSRSIPDKLLGVIALLCSILIMLFLPFVIGKWLLIRSLFFKPFLKVLIIVFIINSFFLGWIGGQPVIPPYYFIGQVSTFIYFLLFLLFAFSSLIENIILKIFVLKNIKK
jgi:quinol-cytochrome oxidoreductase complex cytochrome b subunit